ncbi:laccase subfamily 2 [Stereum hirsutum FP-91666 SS1]|uniref:laccase subfamily 2 n=1 Tax=Stereum hirsutum (strain FP-91666) TaxID=721885 RepID=UPI000440A1BD|nr:laccase subfamily 2 [Stereum hirsutum FP-91666 SS1]EIM92984.1 laccase subfamily 2 [Stereum hirsutum FP-91666 SS1]
MHSTYLSSVLSALILSRSTMGRAVTPLARRAETKDVTLNVVNANLAPDGFNRSMVTVNGTYPGPLITANKGDTLSVTVNNQLADPTMRLSTSIDFDGIFWNTANAFDAGTPFVNTCPIGPNSSFTYEVPLTDQAGSFWYHSQLSVQYSDGLRGPLIVYDPDDPMADLYDVDDESTIIQLGDHWHNSSVALLEHYVATGIVPVSDTGTVNGVGRYNGGPEVPWAVTTVTPGLSHRLRIINQSMRNVFTFSIDGHNLTVIEVDGMAVQPMTVDKLDLLAGQRYSVILVADQAVDNYWINAPYVGGSPARNLNQNSTLSRAILRYAGANETDPVTPMTDGPADGVVLLESNLHPLVATPPPTPDLNFTFNLDVVTGKAIWNVNNVSYLPPDTPTLVKILAGANDSSAFNATENTFILPANKTIQIDFPANEDDESHPFHLHGNNFWVVKSNSSEGVMNEVDPVIRDVVAVGAAGTTVRFRTDNPGPWFFHCHIFWHMQAGLATVMASGLDDIRANTLPDDEWESLCPAYDALPAELQ